MIDELRIARILDQAGKRREQILLETQGFEILEALGFRICPSIFVQDLSELQPSALHALGGRKVVVKVVSPEILHKSESGGVCIVENEPAAIASAIEAMSTRLRGKKLAGFTLNKFIDYDATLGGELLLGLRRTPDFGPVVTIGTGGVFTEFLSENFKPGLDVAVVSCELTREEQLALILSQNPVLRLLTEPPRGQRPRLSVDRLVAAVRNLIWLGRNFGHFIQEFEINPLVVSDGELIALDVLTKLGKNSAVAFVKRPVGKIKRLFQPQSVAIIGVSEKLNPGHVIVDNLLREGFDSERLFIIKPHVDKLAGCRCYPSIESLPEPADLMIVSVSAKQMPATLTEIINTRKAESIVVIPGGLEEKSGGEKIASEMRSALAAARNEDWQGPVINGGNCLGIRSRPGKVDTMFVPQHKLSTSRTAPRFGPVALIAQSGAFALAKTDKLEGIDLKYNLTLGNQIDLTIGDYLDYLKNDSDLNVFGVYVEGFKPLDGVKFLKAAEEISSSGRTIVLYRSGRTAAGVKASSSHTASIAGDYKVTRALARQAGVLVAEALDDFEDLLRLSTYLSQKKICGRRLGAISNAGFECVAFADNLGGFSLSPFSDHTTQRLQEILNNFRIGEVVDVHNPLDLTPMANDDACNLAFQAVMEDENVDVGIFGCVPMTAALNTLARAEQHCEDIERSDSVVQRLITLNDKITKPWVVIVDAGPLYDPLRTRLEASGIPTFKTADQALRIFDLWLKSKTHSKNQPDGPKV